MKKYTQLSWKKRLLSCTFQIFSNNTQVGHLKDSEFSRTAVGALNDRKVKFITRGHLKPRTDIIDYSNNTPIGRVTYSCWYPKARIDYEGQTAQWKFSNIWETRWRIFSDGEQIDFRGHAHKGSATTSHTNDLLLLTGLYISNYYWRLAAIIIASLFPLLIFMN